VSFTPRRLYPRGKSPRYPLDRRLGGPQNWSGPREEEKIVALTETRTPTPRRSSPYPVAIPGLAFTLISALKEKLKQKKLQPNQCAENGQHGKHTHQARRTLKALSRKDFDAALKSCLDKTYVVKNDSGMILFSGS
jgi:hypothetical protein